LYAHATLSLPLGKAPRSVGIASRDLHDRGLRATPKIAQRSKRRLMPKAESV
jgi:hypothetical protein